MPLTILVVDDDPGTRLSVSDYLELSGYYWVVTAKDGQQALELVEKYQPHLIITDITMPRMNGYELVGHVRRQPAFRLLPVIFLTAHTETEDRIRGYRLGCDAYLPKPFELRELDAIVRNLLERSQLFQTEWQRQVQSQEQQETISLQAPAPETEDPKRLCDPALAQSLLHLELTDRENEVLNLLATGLSNGQIGEYLHLSPRTIEKYVSNLLRKTDTSNRSELVRYAIDHHLVC